MLEPRQRYNHIGGMNGVLVVSDYISGDADWQFQRILRRGGMQWEDFLGHATIAEHDHNTLDATIARAQPKAILALGNLPLRLLANQNGITRNRGFIFESKYGIPVVGTFHPNYLLPRKGEKSSSKYTWVIIMDLRKAVRVAAGKRELLPQTYLLDPSVDNAAQFVGEYERTGPETIMAWDLETVFKLKQKNEQKLKLEEKQTITRISFSFKPGYAMTIPWQPEYIEKIIRPVFRMNRPKGDWNGIGFDRPIIRFQQEMELNGVLYDGMDMFHVFQPNIERNLEFVTSLLADHLSPWKHQSQSDPEWYSAVDADAEITNILRLRQMMSEVRVPVYE